MLSAHPPTIERKHHRANEFTSSKDDRNPIALSVSDSVIQIQRGERIYNIPADRTIEISTSNGDTMIIGPGSPVREKRFHDNIPSGQRSRGRRKRNSITEEDMDSKPDATTAKEWPQLTNDDFDQAGDPSESAEAEIGLEGSSRLSSDALRSLPFVPEMASEWTSQGNTYHRGHSSIECP